MTRHFFILTLILLAGGSSAFAKKASIRWKGVKGAERYQIQIKLDQKIIVSDELPKGATKWEGVLEPGLYYYRLRVKDKLERPGLWTEYHPLVARPDAPEGQKAVQDFWTDAAGGIELKWDPIPHVKEYLVVVKQGDKEILKQTAKTNILYIPSIQPGSYEWQVQGILKAGQRVPASILGMQAEGVFSKPYPLTIHKEPQRTKWDVSGGLLYSPYSVAFIPQGGSVPGGAPSTVKGGEGGFGGFGAISRNFNDKWAGSIRAVIDGVRFESFDRQLPELNVLAKHYFTRMEKESAWELSLSAGPQIMSYVIKSGIQISHLALNPAGTPATFGVTFEAGLRRRFTPSLSLGARLSSYTPFGMLYTSHLHETLDSGSLFDQYGIEVDLTYRLFASCALTISASHRQRNVNMTVDSETGSSPTFIPARVPFTFSRTQLSFEGHLTFYFN